MLKFFIQSLIRIYQLAVSPFLGPRCRFYPSCSQYALLSFDKFPAKVALVKVLRRLGRCHPWQAGGVDFP